jgi:predicted ATPase
MPAPVAHPPDAPPAPAPPPVRLTRLVGRSRELAELWALLGASRLVTLTGAGGSGKTRLASALAEEYGGTLPAERAWIELASLTDENLLANQVAAAFRPSEQPGRSAVDALAEAIGERAFLLALDNCEHLLDACATLADTLLRRCPGLRILATSRQALGVAGERAWPVPPLVLPPSHGGLAPADVLGSEAVQLFLERAKDALPSFVLTDENAAAVARICHRLGGLPLAIELAAARIRVLPPEQLANRLEDVFALLTTGARTALPRHRTLRATIDWSYELLSGSERVLFERLSVFPGGFGLDAAESVCAGEGLAGAEVLDLLAGLVDQSLVVVQEQQGEARYDLLEPIRQYASQRLHSRGESRGDPEALREALRRRHALHYLALAEDAQARMHRERQLLWFARLEAEHDNLRAALAWSLGAGEAAIAARLCVALREFWRTRGHLSEGRRWLAEALRLPAIPDSLRAQALCAAAVLARPQGEYAAAHALLVEAEELARQAGDRRTLADALTHLGSILRDQGSVAAGCERLEEAIGLWRDLGDPHGLVVALSARASLALLGDDLTHARSLREEAAAVSRRMGDREGEARALLGLGEVARIAGDLAGARTCYDQSLALFRELGDDWHASAALYNLGWVSAGAGEYETSVHCFAEGFRLFLPISTHHPLILALTLSGLARLLHARGDAEEAAAAVATVKAQVERTRAIPAAADLREWERTRVEVRAALGEEAFARAWSRGLVADAAEAVARAFARLGVAISGSGFPVRGIRPAPATTPTPAAPPEQVTSPPPEADAPALPPDLRVLALGPLQIFREGVLLPNDAWGSAKPGELLLYLLCHPDGCTREQVGLAFWPESTAAQVSNSFHVTLHRLRKALGHAEWIAIVSDRYRVSVRRAKVTYSCRWKSCRGK